MFRYFSLTLYDGCYMYLCNRIDPKHLLYRRRTTAGCLEKPEKADFYPSVQRHDPLHIPV